MSLHCYQADFQGVPVLVELAWEPGLGCYTMSISWLGTGQEIEEHDADYYCGLFETRLSSPHLDVYLTQLASLGMTLPIHMIRALREERHGDKVTVNNIASITRWTDLDTDTHSITFIEKKRMSL